MPDYRYPNEQLILALTVILVLAVIAFTSLATLCGSLVFVALMLATAYFMNQAHHQALVRGAQAVTAQTVPQLAELVQETAARLQLTDEVQTYVAAERRLNAYTFGLSNPKVIVLYGGLFQVFDKDELRFIIGHEMGHIHFGHTRLNSLLGGMAGIPSPFGAAVILYVAFRWWNRACEYTADRAGLVACGRVDKAVSALVKLATGGKARSAYTQQAALEHLERQDENPSQLFAEVLSTHPLIANRIEELRKFANSAEYQNLKHGRFAHG